MHLVEQYFRYESKLLEKGGTDGIFTPRNKFVFKFSYRNEFSENSSLPQFDAFENITGEAVPAY